MKWTKIIYLSAMLLLTACVGEKNKQIDNTENLPVENNYYCYLKTISVNKDQIFAEVDFIDYKKIDELKHETTNEDLIKLPNGFCFINTTKKIQKIELSENTKVITQTFSFNDEGNFNFNQKVGLKEFIEHFNSEEVKPFKFSPYKITIRNKKVINLKEIYIP